MVVNIPLPTASSLLQWSNFTYLFGSLLTLISAGLVLYEKHSRNQGRQLKWLLRTEIAVVVAAFISLFGSTWAIIFSDMVSHLKDIELASYQKSADAQIAKADKEAADANKASATANQKAEETRLKAETIGKENASLRINLAIHETEEHEAEAKLNSQNQQLTQFTQGLAQQQQGMAQQMQSTPSLNDSQVALIAAQMKPFAGRNIPIFTMMDAHAQRLAGHLEQAFKQAGIKVEGSSTMLGGNYEGIQIVVRHPESQKAPQVALTLWNALHSVGLNPKMFFDATLGNDEAIRVQIGPD